MFISYKFMNMKKATESGGRSHFPFNTVQWNGFCQTQSFHVSLNYTSNCKVHNSL